MLCYKYVYSGNCDKFDFYKNFPVKNLAKPKIYYSQNSVIRKVG